jgi:hypothetical protein
MKRKVVGCLSVIAVVLIFAAASALITTNDEINRSTARATPTRAAFYDVTYEVHCSSGKVSMTYRNAYGDTEQIDVRNVVWTKEMEAQPGAFLYVSAQNQYDHGDVSCRILVNGVEVRKSKSSGAYVIATCSGRL